MGSKVALCPPAVTCSIHSFPFRLRLALFHNYGCGRCFTVLASPLTQLSIVTKALPSQPHSVVFPGLSTGSLTLSHGIQLQLSFTVNWISNTSCFQNQHHVKQCLQHCPVLLLVYDVPWPPWTTAVSPFVCWSEEHFLLSQCRAGNFSTWYWSLSYNCFFSASLNIMLLWNFLC